MQQMTKFVIVTGLICLGVAVSEPTMAHGDVDEESTRRIPESP